MKTWDDWSDLEINKAVAIAKGQKVIQQYMVNIGRVWAIEGWDGGIYKIPDYCNSWADMGPIIFNSGITIIPYQYQDESQGWFSTADTSFFVDDKNPLRAAAIVFLMMNGDKAAWDAYESKRKGCDV